MPTFRLTHCAVFTLLLASCASESGANGAADGATTTSDVTSSSGSTSLTTPTASDTGTQPLPGTSSGATSSGANTTPPTGNTATAMPTAEPTGPVTSGSTSETSTGASSTTGPTNVPSASGSQSSSAGSGGVGAPNGSGGDPKVGGMPNGGGGGEGTAGAGAAADAGVGGGSPLDDGPKNPDATTLRDKYEGYFNIGAAVDAQSYSTHADILTTHFNSVTSENDMKFESLQPTQGNFTWSAADQMVDWAGNNGITVRGHALVWHRQTPTWVFAGSGGGDATREQLLSRMQDHISAVLAHFKGKVQVWDVVNEAILNDGKFRTAEAAETIDQSGWYRILGEDYIPAAFRYAREADPDVKLFYNDYYNYIPAKREGIVKMLQKMIDEGVPIDGVGLQCHVNIEPSTVETHQSYHQTVQNMEEAIKAYSALGLEVHITEMDMSLYIGGRTYDASEFYTLETFTDDLAQKQAERYREFFQLFRRYRDAITSVTFWGVADDNTWLSEFSSGRKDFPLLFDVNHDPKPAFDAVMDF
jgi:endo-1,4-beta-xylanase